MKVFCLYKRKASLILEQKKHTILHWLYGLIQLTKGNLKFWVSFKKSRWYWKLKCQKRSKFKKELQIYTIELILSLEEFSQILVVLNINKTYWIRIVEIRVIHKSAISKYSLKSKVSNQNEIQLQKDWICNQWILVNFNQCII